MNLKDVNLRFILKLNTFKQVIHRGIYAGIKRKLIFLIMRRQESVRQVV